MTRLRVTAAAIPVAALCVCGCAGGTGTDDSGGTSGSSTSTTSGSQTTDDTGNGNNGNGNDGTGGNGDEAFPYTPWGPDDPPIPSQYAALAAAPGSPPRCSDVAAARPGGEFWALAVDVCLAITGQGPWPDATSVPDPPAPGNAYIACLDDELAAMLAAALDWHADHPDQDARVVYPDSSTRSPCQSRVYDVRVLDEDDLVPGEGHPDGVGVAITASGLRGDSTVTVDGREAELTGDFVVPDPGDGLGTLVVLAPSSPAPRTVELRMATARGDLEASVDLPGTGATPSGGGTTTEEPEPTGTATQPEPTESVP